MYAYIDESGDTGYTKKSTRYFILTVILIDDPFVLQRVVKDIHKFKTKKRRSHMIHSHREDDVVKNKLVKKLVSLNRLQCKSFVFDKNKIKSTDLYFYGLNILATYFYSLDISEVVIAKRDTRSSYNKKLICVFENLYIKMVFSDPTVDKSLQIADFYSWCIFLHIERNYSYYFLKLENQIEMIDAKQSPRGTYDLS